MPSLRERLHRLRPDAVVPATPANAESNSLAERLRRLDPSRRRAASPRAPDEQALADQLGAMIVAPGVLLLERSQPLNRRHGRFRLADCAIAMPKLFADASTDPVTWAFIDTETSGLAGGTGTWAFTCGLGRIDGDRLLLRQWLLTRLDSEPRMLALLADALSDVELLISFNGKSFDLPLLQTRLRLARPEMDAGRDAASRLAATAHLDLLHPLRRAFASRWPDCRLASAEQRLLGFQRDDDLPGAEAPAAWLDWLRRGDGARLGAVLRHNRLDLVSLLALVPALVAVEHDPLANGADLGALARHRMRRGDACGARALLQAAQPLLMPTERLLLASLCRRAGDWAQALAQWERLAAEHEPTALEALAKYHEHRGGDLRQALALVQRLPSGPARERRELRLCRKLNEVVSTKLPLSC